MGVFAGMASNTYYLNNLHSHPELVEQVGRMAIGMGNEKDFLATRTAYKLNLKGPAISANTACSTSLVAVCLAAQSLMTRQCDMALAGGVAISFPQKRANLYQEGSIFSPDGVTRPFDAKAAGTYFSDGLALFCSSGSMRRCRMVDRIYAVIKGIGLNNDGSDKVGYTAPSVQGQAEAISRAQAHAGISPRLDFLRRGAWHGHGAGRPDRAHRADTGVPHRNDEEEFLRAGFGQRQLRALRRRGRHRWLAQDHARAPAQTIARVAALQRAEPENRFRQQPPFSSTRS